LILLVQTVVKPLALYF